LDQAARSNFQAECDDCRKWRASYLYQTGLDRPSVGHLSGKREKTVKTFAKLALAGGATLVMLGTASAASREPLHRLTCDQIATRIQAANGPIGDENNSWLQLQRNPTAQFVLLGIVTPDPEHDAAIDRLRAERNALIVVAVDKNCAAERGLTIR
jgi:hypothetical protein